MSVCTTCYQHGIRDYNAHDCPGLQSIVVHREDDQAVIVEAPQRSAIDLQLLLDERSTLTMPGPDLIDLAGQVVYRVVDYADGRLIVELVEDRRPPKEQPVPDLLGALNEIAARWEHGHAELTDGCALCLGKWAEVYKLLHGPV